MIADAIVMFFCDVGGQPILHLSYYNASSFKDPLLLNTFGNFTSSNCLRLIDVIIVHLTLQLATYLGQEYFNALIKEVIDSVIMDFVNDAYLEEELEDF